MTQPQGDPVPDPPVEDILPVVEGVTPGGDPNLPALLEMRGIVKVFPGVRALDGVDLQVRAGEVHCLLGQNGAGKSTLIKVLAGAHRPDDGEIRWDDEPVQLANPLAAVRHGISTIYQELDLVDGLSVTENIFLGHELSAAGFSNRQGMRKRTRDLLTRLGHPEIRASDEVRHLSAAQKQIVSMARALSHDVRLIIMDEPSAVLDPDGVENLFRLVNDLRRDGVAVIYISHRLDEIRRIGDRITVLKDGRTVGTNLPAGTPTNDLIRLMTGRSIEYVFPQRPGVPADAPLVLTVDGLSRRGEFSDVSLSVRAGEIVGIAGLVGAGRSEVLETIYGARRAESGTVTVDGKSIHRSVTSAVAAGIGLCPEERKTQGLLLMEPVFQNVSVSSMRRFSVAGFLRRGAEFAAAKVRTEELDVRPADPARIVRTLSGGNQQKVVLARWLLKGCRVLMLDEPTRGVDVGARAEIYAVIRQLADSGIAVLVVSSEIEEVLGLADRVLVMAEGRVLYSGEAGQIDEQGVLDLVMRGRAA